jgi:hypothetical protein
MTISQVINSFAHDGYLQAVLVMIALDVLLGVIASVKTGQFKFSWLAGFGKDDLLGKVLPWFLIYTAAKYAPDVAVLGIDLSSMEKVVFALVVAALGGSMLASLKDLGVPLPTPPQIPRAFGGEREPPPEP